MTIDLRSHPHEDVLQRVETTLRVSLDRTRCVRKRRSIGAPTDRSTWIRIEARPPDKLHGQGNGVAATAELTGIAKPTWHAGIAWNDAQRELIWRVDETDLVTATPIKSGGTLTVDPNLPTAWWARLNTSLDALSTAHTSRVATLHTIPMTQTRLSAGIARVFPELADTILDEWTVAHADLSWANVTAPEFWLLDWEDWGRAPRGLDAAMLWTNSLAVPQLADRVRSERAADLSSRSGQLVSLYFCCEILAPPAGYNDPLLEPASSEAQRLLAMLHC
ncbi:hypothetical protein ACIA8G_21565 [Lentzea sp. NPDC051213]|uniref:hypothetical protein n=1 Tax=Lentzea sp. NPDC051213 TaxID=3364126 RepID=UPI00379836B9